MRLNRTPLGVLAASVLLILPCTPLPEPMAAERPDRPITTPAKSVMIIVSGGAPLLVAQRNDHRVGWLAGHEVRELPGCSYSYGDVGEDDPDEIAPDSNAVPASDSAASADPMAPGDWLPDVHEFKIPDVFAPLSGSAAGSALLRRGKCEIRISADGRSCESHIGVEVYASRFGGLPTANASADDSLDAGDTHRWLVSWRCTSSGCVTTLTRLDRAKKRTGTH